MSTAGASLLAQVIVAKNADHLPLNRQETIFQRHGVDISRKTMGGWLAQCADLLQRCMDRRRKCCSNRRSSELTIQREGAR